MTHTFPKLHNAMWPGLVGKGSPGAEPAIDLDTMLDLTAQASVDGVKFDGVDLFLFDPHVSIDASDRRSESGSPTRSRAKGLVVGSLVAPVWPPTGGGSAMGQRRGPQELPRRRSARRVRSRRSCATSGIRSYGVVRIDSASGPADWAKDPDGNTETHRRDVPPGVRHRRRLRRAARGRRRDLLGRHAQLEADGASCSRLVDRPKTLGFQADMAHTLLFTHGLQRARRTGILPEDYDWKQRETSRRGAADR